MDGAVEAGERAAREVLAERSLIPRDQVLQEEPEFPVRFLNSQNRFFSSVFYIMHVSADRSRDMDHDIRQ